MSQIPLSARPNRSLTQHETRQAPKQAPRKLIKERRTHSFFLFLIAILPLFLTLVGCQMFFSSGKACYLFWQNWITGHPDTTRSMQMISKHTVYIFQIYYALVLFFALQRGSAPNVRLVIAYFIVHVFLCILTIDFIKNVFGLPRPYMNTVVGIPWSYDTDYQSFPSYDTTEIITMLIPLALWRGRKLDAFICGMVIFFLGSSQVYLGFHSLFDVFGGLAFGCMGAGFVLFFSRGAGSMSLFPDNCDLKHER